MLNGFQSLKYLIYELVVLMMIQAVVGMRYSDSLLRSLAVQGLIETALTRNPNVDMRFTGLKPG